MIFFVVALRRAIECIDKEVTHAYDEDILQKVCSYIFRFALPLHARHFEICFVF